MLKRQRYKADDGKVRIAHRNDPCPCGREKIVRYPGTRVPDQVKRLKFKYCCLEGRTSAPANITSTHENLKARRAKFGWPMREWLALPTHRKGTR
jgi:hypothetical protein